MNGWEKTTRQKDGITYGHEENKNIYLSLKKEDKK